ncbi:unnamed protein product [Protopolystoma xenopodis]|uniref:Uncharacterized protein n=1 Tax=Protopolystoma xenopodis TaxID=117903 RepID=A0A3S5CRE0_9PLAT|nr:unnamed protein product [Protopolystoma xenopodis]
MARLSHLLLLKPGRKPKWKENGCNKPRSSHQRKPEVCPKTQMTRKLTKW